MRKLVFTTLAVAAAVSLTACQNDDVSGKGSDKSSTSAASAEVSATSSDGDSGPSSTDQGSGTDSARNDSSTQDTTSGNAGNAGNAKCRTDQLTITATVSPDSSDEDPSVTVAMKNTGGQACTTFGFAGVDLQTNYGPVSAKRRGEPATPHTLEAGQSTYFSIGYPANETGGTGITVTGLKVTPPGETKSVALDWPGARSLPISDGSDTLSPVAVHPIGSAGQGN
ncbi:DUF4232 domain-containing protein [Streptomyces sp. CoH17]|uniref:DUF4232 domain-containing protein n=1 Tax=Streptomyces sp. CoH17 TaxID=2992806 RepID=UPI00226DFC8F|nr:DUF4232 domain-containing protein [Streptomyces sp. CoH17]